MPVVKGLSAVQSTTKCKESDFEYLETMAQSAGFEPATVRLEGGCSIQLSYGRLTVRPPEYPESGRGREIRTPDILLPKQARYQTALYPVN